MTIPWAAIYAEAKGWQTAIGAVLGFGGLIAGALFNARLNRKRDKRLRAEEIASVASALYGEIIVFRSSLARMANAVARRYVQSRSYVRSGEAFDPHFIEQISLPPLRLYPALVAKVGMLPGSIALDIVQFYARMEQAQAWLPRLREIPERPYTYSVNYVLDPALEAIELVSPALVQIERLAGITASVDKLDVTDAEQAQDAENIHLESWN